MAQQIAALVRTNGEQFPGEREVVYRLRAGANGAGRILHEVRGRGNVGRQEAADLCIRYANEHDIKIATTIGEWDD
jgi:hypothetical protein